MVEVNGFVMVAICQDGDPRYKLIYPKDITCIYLSEERDVTVKKLEELLGK